MPSKNEITVITPKSLVDYGLAQAMGPGHDSLNLQTKATVAIKSANISTLPFYAYTGCDYGPQTISEPNNGHAATTVNLFAPTDTNAATMTSLTPTTAASEQHDDHADHHGYEPEQRLARRLLRVGQLVGRSEPRGHTRTRPWSRRRKTNTSDHASPCPTSVTGRAERLVRAGEDRHELVGGRRPATAATPR